MKIEFLRSLLAVIRHGSFAAAAPHVNLTASAVGMQIKQLEAYFGQLLFDRSGRQVQPTAFALELAAKVRDTLEALEAMRARPESSVSGNLWIGVIESAQIAMLPAAMRALRSSAPLLELHFVRGVSQFLLQEVKAGRSG